MPHHRLIVPLLLLASALGAGEANVDRIHLQGGRVMEVAAVDSETRDEVIYRHAANSPPAKLRAATVVRVLYAGMVAEGIWKAGEEARERGRYEDAGDRFASLAAGEREWEKVYGGFAAGECLELAGKYEDAANAFAAVAQNFPQHRLALDALLRQGINLAMAKKADEAGKVAEALADLGKTKIGSVADSRGYAVRAAIFLAAENAGKFDEFQKKAIIRPEEREAWFHWNLWCAEAYRKLNRPKDVAQVVDRMLPALDGDAGRKARAMAVKGLSLLDTDPLGAVVTLLRLDALPYGSEDEKCEARWHAGRLLLKEAEAQKAQPGLDQDESRQRVVRELDRAARLLLGAAAVSTSSSSTREQAKTLFETTWPKPVSSTAAVPVAAPAPAPAPAAPAPAPEKQKKKGK